MIRRPPRSTLDRSSAASDVYKRQIFPSNKILIDFFFLLIFGIVFLSCSPTKRIFDADNESDPNLYGSIRVLLLESFEEISIKIGSKIILSNESNKLAEIKTGNSIMLSINSNNLLAKISDQDFVSTNFYFCLLYTSDAADERSSVDLGGRRIIKKKKNNNYSIDSYIYKEQNK